MISTSDAAVAIERAGRSPSPKVAVGGAGAAAGLAVGAGAHAGVALGLVAVAVLALLAFRRPFGFLCLFILVRPLLDAETDQKLRVGSLPALNLSGLLALLVLAAAGLAVVRTRPRTLPRTFVAFAPVLIVSLGAAVWALHGLRAQVHADPIRELVRLATLAAVVLLAAVVVRSVRRAQIVFACVGLSAVGPALSALYQLVHGVPLASDLTIGRVYGTFTGPNALGLFLAATALLLLYLPTPLLSGPTRYAFLVPILIALGATFSRSGWIMFGLGLVAHGWTRHKRVVLAIVALCLLVGAAVPSVRDRVTGRDRQTGLTYHGLLPESYQWRIDTWRGLLRTYERKPLTGYGLKTAAAVDPRRVPGDPRIGYDPHNSAVKLLVEGGPLLLAAWVAWFGVLVARLRTLARRKWPLARFASLTALIWLLCAFISLTSDDLLAATALLYGLLALTGALEGAASESAPAG